MLRSADAMSGRRCSSSEGNTTGIGGMVPVSAPGGSDRSDGGWPVSTAIACSYSARRIPTDTRFALVVATWVSASSRSVEATVPALYSLRVIRALSS